MECVTIITTVVRLLPTSHMLATPGGNISFTCLPLYTKSEIETFEWKVNQTLLKERDDAQNIETHSSAADNGLGTLMINGVPSQYNMTTVQCGVTFSSGQKVDSNLASIMILQGTVFHCTSNCSRSMGEFQANIFYSKMPLCELQVKLVVLCKMQL